MKRSLYIFSCMLVFSIASPSLAALSYSGGHADIGVAYEDGALNLHFHAEGADIGGLEDVSGEYHPDEITILIPDHALTVRQDGPQWAFTGNAAGQALWVLPQTHSHSHTEDHHDHEVPFLGIGAEELPTGLFQGDQVTMTLLSVSGPGDFSLWTADAFGLPTAYMSSFDPASATALALAAGLHGHYNWGFTAPGTYQVELLITGTLLDGQTASGSGVYTFQVVPEPASLVLFALGLSRLRRKNILD